MIKGLLTLIRTLLKLARAAMLKKNKGHVAIFFQSPHIGGGRTYLRALIEFLKKKQMKVHLFFAEGDYDSDTEQFCRSAGVPVSVIAYPRQLFYSGPGLSIGFLKYAYNYLRHLNYILDRWMVLRPEFTFVSSGWPFYLFYALLIPGRKYFVQHVMPMHPLDKGNHFFLRRALRFWQVNFLAVSEFAKGQMQQYWIGRYPNISTIYNYFEKKKDYPPARGKGLSILCLARVEDGKNPFLWIELAKTLLIQFPDLQFTWAGKGRLLEEARHRVSAYPTIRFLGFMEDVDSLYSKADVYFEASKREAHGISVVGAMAWKLPVIATNNGGTTESVIHGTTGYTLDMEDQNTLMNMLIELISNKPLRQKMGQQGYKRYLQLFTRERWEARMEEQLGI